MSYLLKFLYIATAMGVPIDDVMRKHLPKEKPYTICNLPKCDNTTQHNGEYCCAKHHEEHKLLLRK